jgi:hypothetical protein
MQCPSCGKRTKVKKRDAVALPAAEERKETGNRGSLAFAWKLRSLIGGSGVMRLKWLAPILGILVIASGLSLGATSAVDATGLQADLYAYVQSFINSAANMNSGSTSCLNPPTYSGGQFGNMENNLVNPPGTANNYGVSVHFKWSDLEQTNGGYTWQPLDDVMYAAFCAGKQVLLRVEAGHHIPSWLGSTHEIYTCAASGDCAVQEIPWDSTFQSDYEAFLSHLSTHLKGLTSGGTNIYSIVKSVQVAGVGAVGEDRLDSNAAWKTSGYTDAKYVSAIETLAKTAWSDFGVKAGVDIDQPFSCSSCSVDITTTSPYYNQPPFPSLGTQSWSSGGHATTADVVVSNLDGSGNVGHFTIQQNGMNSGYLAGDSYLTNPPYVCSEVSGSSQPQLNWFRQDVRAAALAGNQPGYQISVNDVGASSQTQELDLDMTLNDGVNAGRVPLFEEYGSDAQSTTYASILTNFQNGVC